MSNISTLKISKSRNLPLEQSRRSFPPWPFRNLSLRGVPVYILQIYILFPTLDLNQNLPSTIQAKRCPLCGTTYSKLDNLEIATFDYLWDRTLGEHKNSPADITDNTKCVAFVKNKALATAYSEISLNPIWTGYEISFDPQKCLSNARKGFVQDPRLNDCDIETTSNNADVWGDQLNAAGENWDRGHLGL